MIAEQQQEDSDFSDAGVADQLELILPRVARFADDISQLQGRISKSEMSFSHHLNTSRQQDERTRARHEHLSGAVDELEGTVSGISQDLLTHCGTTGTARREVMRYVDQAVERCDGSVAGRVSQAESRLRQQISEVEDRVDAVVELMVTKAIRAHKHDEHSSDSGSQITDR
eukprot:gnl/Dysnectes_brevis/7536_a12732_320.p1 GENE.gnl/Dysnectes_brevis/7536_a12732_320~~gnl/Dysnectes_brevis/7536_a12732_320.p1  ORF type:complete len:180 (+),score=53.50 gnl/Dysnectes_brevis/7536_a12732_320:28-540(+)